MKSLSETILAAVLLTAFLVFMYYLGRASV